MLQVNPKRCTQGVKFHRTERSRSIVQVKATGVIERPEVITKKNQYFREGGDFKLLVQKQADKKETNQASILQYLAPLEKNGFVEVLVVGCGPAGLALAGALADQGLSVTIVSPDVPFTNNYGVWYDEFKAIGLEHTLDTTWKDTKCFFGDQELDLGRAYSRVSRELLRNHLLGVCRDGGVRYVCGEVVDVQSVQNKNTSKVILQDGEEIESRLVCLAAGGAAGRFLKYESGAPPVTAQTAYGIEAHVENYEQMYPIDKMLFMDYRRHHTGVWSQSLLKNSNQINHYSNNDIPDNEVPSFLYGMPLGGNRVFLEETCLVARPPMPFETLKRRLNRRLDALGINVKQIFDEEWSYIPVGGPLPIGSQDVVAFGASACLVHPSTGYSIARSLREAPQLAQKIVSVLRSKKSRHETAEAVWDVIWSREKRAQASFHVFGMELLNSLSLKDIESFFSTFFNLPRKYWEGYLASTLSSYELMVFALLTYVFAPANVRFVLLKHMVSDPSMMYLLRCYLNIFVK
eukprot:TRINITY_DN32399_c0_g4_i1.p1 TRINITY_DN32399_c0_g4~~TRINITY_DN32399_c0_g4_i1.p1  ORF type:complete len:583 (+),score=89.72 TRINITY_DN32399_c0_g4_i1:197-1750(+)